MNIKGKTTLTFDCYGTLIDWETGIWDGFQQLLQTNNCKLMRKTCLEAFAEIESTVQHSSQTDFIQSAATDS